MAFSISYQYQIIDRFTKPLKKISNSAKGFEKRMAKSTIAADKFSKKMLNVGTGIAAVAGIVGGAKVLDTFVGFETSMNKLNAVTLGTDEVMSKFRDTAKNLGKTTQFSASQAAQGMTFLAQAGLTTDKVLEAIPGTLQLAAAGNIDLGTAADIATNVLAQMGLEVKDLTRVNDVLSMVQARANTGIIEAAEAMKNLGTTSGALGVSLEQTTALIGAMANAGVKGGESGTLLRNALLKVVNPSTKAQKTFRKLGIDLKQFTTPEGKIKNFTGLLEKLKKTGATTTDIFNIFEERGGRAILALQTQGKPAIDALEQSLTGISGTAEKMQAIQMKGLPGVMKAMASAWEAVQIAIFESGLDVVFMGIFKAIGAVARMFASLPKPIVVVVGAIGAMLAVVAPLMAFMGVLVAMWPALVAGVSLFGAALAILTGPIGLVVAGVAALIAGITFLVANWDKVASFFGFGDTESVTADAGGKANTLNGSITVAAEAGSKVKSAEMNSSSMGDLGMNMAGAGA